MSAEATSKKGKAAAKKPAEHPKYIEMIIAAINALKERNGSSRQAILKYIKANYKVNDSADVHVKPALKKGVTSGALVQAKGTGASGSFKVAKPVPKAPKPKKKTETKAKKPGKKTTAKTTAKPGKATKGKKSPGAKAKDAKKKTSPKKGTTTKSKKTQAKPAKKPTKKTTAPKIKKTPAKKKPAKSQKAKSAK